METLAQDSALPTLETPIPELPDGSTLDALPEVAVREAEREEEIASELAALRTRMRSPGERSGTLTDDEAFARDLITNTMRLSRDPRFARRMRAHHLAKRLGTRIVEIRAEAEQQ